MYRRKRQIVEIPKLKMTKTRGMIGYRFLEIVDKEPFRKVSEVRKEFKPIVINDKQERAKRSPRLWKSYEKLCSTPAREEKLFDTEYCAVRDFLEAFDLVAPLGPRANEEITLTYFGSKLLQICKENNVKNIFANSAKEFMARVFIFIDNYKHWNFIQIIQKRGPITIENFLTLLFQLGIGFDSEKIKRDIAAKPSFKRWLNEEWRKEHRLAPVDLNWKEQMINETVKVKARENAYVSTLLNLYMDYGLVKKDNGLLYPNASYIKQLQEKRFWITSDEVDHTLFFQEMYEAYRKLIRNRGVVSVPIPELRRATCLRSNMPWYSFDRVLQKRPMGYKEYEVTLTRASSRKKLDLSINSKHFYYIQLKKLHGGV
jgi:hypothetical protein